MLGSRDVRCLSRGQMTSQAGTNQEKRTTTLYKGYTGGFLNVTTHL
jgi:hypothetical protein